MDFIEEFSSLHLATSFSFSSSSLFRLLYSDTSHLISSITLLGYYLAYFIILVSL